MSTTSRIVDGEDLREQLDDLVDQEVDVSSTDALEQSITDPKPADSIPEKYQGKSVEEIIKMHSEAEKIIGRQGTELGELRRSVDKILQNQLQNSNQSNNQEEETDSEFDLLEPEKSVDERISKHPSIQRLDQLERSLAYRDFESKHPDWQATVTDSEFNDWVQKSPTRMKMYQAADNHDYNSATDLLDQWKEWQSVLHTAKEEEQKLEKEVKEKQLNDGMTESGTSTGTSKKKFRRVELQRLYSTDPERYAALQPEIILAYKEGRVI